MPDTRQLDRIERMVDQIGADVGDIKTRIALVERDQETMNASIEQTRNRFWSLVIKTIAPLVAGIFGSAATLFWSKGGQ